MRIQPSSAALIRYLGLICLSATLFCGSAHAQGTYTAASCNQSDVSAVINGPTHTAVSGDTIVIPAGTCTWTSGITVSGKGIDITGTGTPNTGGGTFGAGAAATTLVDHASGPFFAFTNLTYGETAKVELLNMSGSGAGQYSINAPISFAGTCTVSGCANIRVDNINFTAGTWGSPLAAGYVIVDNVFGVVDHTTTNESTGTLFLVQVNFDAWQGIGAYGDSSFASPDTFGTEQAMYMENNSLSGVRISENDVSPGATVGGARYVCRFNQVLSMPGDGLCGAHGTAWGGRFRGQRQVEVYYNAITSTGCDALDGLNSGTGYFLSNSISGTCNKMTDLDIARFIQTGAPWGSCDGTMPWDQSPFSSSSQCLDQPGRGAGLLLQGGSNTGASGMIELPIGTSCNGALLGVCFPNPALDPVYEAGEVSSNNAPGVQVAGDGSSTRVLANRDYYEQVSDVAQTSPSSPFNGTSGTGYGALANRPTSCTTGVGYWATDQGSWNTYNSQRGELFTCTATNTWTLKYTPYTYPHPLTTGGTMSSGLPDAPSNLTATVE